MKEALIKSVIPAKADKSAARVERPKGGPEGERSESSSFSNISGLLDPRIRGEDLFGGSLIQKIWRNTKVRDARLAYDASTEVREVIARIGRTEDVKLSPDNSRLAIVDYLDNKVFLFSIRIENSATSPRITILDYSIITSESLREPHGIAFLGNDHLIVCNRAADVCVFRISVPGELPRERNYKPLASINGKGTLWPKVKTPGSVDCYEIAENCYRFLVCSNHWNFVTSHIIWLGNNTKIRSEGILIENRLNIPDGVGFSGDNAWIAISNHADGEVLIYKHTLELNKKTAPAAILRGIVCPHGVRFTSDGRVLVADAASQYLRVYESKGGNWNGVQEPTRSIRLIDDETFYSGRYDSREGGVKGIDIDNSNRVLITTHCLDVLGFHDLTKLLSSDSNVNVKEMAELCQQRDLSVNQKNNGAANPRWTLKARVRDGLFRLQNKWRDYKGAIRSRLKLCNLYSRNRWSSESVLDPSGPVLSLTTHSYRLERVFYAIESIANGRRKPSQINLWITDEESYLHPPATLQRLKLRGLEIHITDDLGPHTKYYPYVNSEKKFDLPLVTADDDVIYPREWLQQLIAGYEANSSAIHCFRAHRMRMTNTRLLPYNSWTPCENKHPSHLNFITGVSGVIYPPDYLTYLKQYGKAFMQCCPTNDDIWLTVIALRGGFKIAQLKDNSEHFTAIPKTYMKRLYDFNVLLGANQIQLIRTYSEVDLSALWNHQQASEGRLIPETPHEPMRRNGSTPISPRPPTPQLVLAHGAKGRDG